jgi:hypothetical protein
MPVKMVLTFDRAGLLRGAAWAPCPRSKHSPCQPWVPFAGQNGVPRDAFADWIGSEDRKSAWNRGLASLGGLPHGLLVSANEPLHPIDVLGKLGLI